MAFSATRGDVDDPPNECLTAIGVDFIHQLCGPQVCTFICMASEIARTGRHRIKVLAFDAEHDSRVTAEHLGHQRCVKSMTACGVAMLLSLSVVGCNRVAPVPPPASVPEVQVCVPVDREVTDHEDFTGQTGSG